MWRRGFLVTVFVLLGIAGAQTDGTVPWDLVERIVGGQDANLYVGELPSADELGFNLPLPEGARVVGSTLSGEGEAYNAAVYLETEGSSDETVSFYRRALLAAGWEEGQIYEPSAGFLPSGASQEATFCRDTTFLYFNNPYYASTISAPVEGEPTQVTVQLYSDPSSRGYTPCDRDERDRYYGPPIPALEAPPEATASYFNDLGGGDERLLEHLPRERPERGGAARVLRRATSRSRLDGA